MFGLKPLHAVIALVLLTAGAAWAHGYGTGSIRIEHPWAAATPPGASVGAGYMTIKNLGNTQVRLLRASSPAAERVELHSMSVEGGVMRMRELIGGVTIPARSVFKFTTGGAHFMLIGLKKPLNEEDMVDLRLIFEGGQTVDVELYVQARPMGGHRH